MEELIDKELIESLKSQIIDKIYEIKNIHTKLDNLYNEYNNNKTIALGAIDELKDFRSKYKEEKEELAITFKGNAGEKRQASMEVFLTALNKRINHAENDIIPDINKTISVLETKKEYYLKKQIEISKQLESYEITKPNASELQTLLDTAKQIVTNGLAEIKEYDFE